MPLNKYFGGSGDKVMRSMVKQQHGDTKAAKREFYATANARKDPARRIARRSSGRSR